MRPLTPKQLEVLQFIRSQQEANGYWPSIREIKEHFEFASTNAVVGHMKALMRKGVIARIPGQARTFKINEKNIHVPEFAEDTFPVAFEIKGSIAAGFPDGIEPTPDIAQLQVDRPTARALRKANTFALRVTGDSMINADIHEGDIVVAEIRPPMDGEIVAALIDGETTLKRFIQKNDQTPYLKAENPNYPNLHPLGDLIIQGVVKIVIRHI